MLCMSHNLILDFLMLNVSVRCPCINYVDQVDLSVIRDQVVRHRRTTASQANIKSAQISDPKPHWEGMAPRRTPTTTVSESAFYFLPCFQQSRRTANAAKKFGLLLLRHL